jgi:hypothetical protein
MISRLSLFKCNKILADKLFLSEKNFLARAKLSPSVVYRSFLKFLKFNFINKNLMASITERNIQFYTLEINGSEKL